MKQGDHRGLLADGPHLKANAGGKGGSYVVKLSPFVGGLVPGRMALGGPGDVGTYLALGSRRSQDVLSKGLAGCLLPRFAVMAQK